MRYAIAVALFVLVPAALRAESDSALPLVVEPDLYSYTLAIPERWAFSFEQASKFGVSLVLFAEGADFHQSNSVMYVTELCKRECRDAVSGEIFAVLDNARAGSPALVVEPGEPIQTKSGVSAPVRILSGASDPRQKREALAFVGHEEVITLLVLSTKDTSSWDKDYAAFRQAVAGYQLFTCATPGLRVGCKQPGSAGRPS